MSVNLNIGKAVVAKIKADKSISLSRFCACVVEEDTKYPYAVYYRDSVSTEESKDTATGINRSVVVINVVSDKYDQSLNLAQKIVDSYDGMRGTIGGCRIQSCRVTDCGETFSNNAFIQSISIEIKYY